MVEQASSNIVVNAMVIASLCFWGVWGIFDKKALAYTSPVGQLAAVYCFAPILGLVLAAILTFTSPGWQLSNHTLYFVGLGSLAYFIATLSYLVAMSRGEASLILGATASYPVVAQLLAYIMLGEQLVPARLIGCAVVVAGIVAISGSGKMKQEHLDLAQIDKANSVRERVSAIMIPVLGVSLAVIGWACRGIFDKIAIDAATPLEVNLARYVCDTAFGAVSVAWVYSKRSQIQFFNARGLWPCAAGSAACLAGGSAAYYVALSKLSASYVIAITGCYPVVMYVLAMLVLKERFNFPRAVGIALITLGGILTQTTQNC